MPAHGYLKMAAIAPILGSAVLYIKVLGLLLHIRIPE